ncbi:GNAT family N-acetyltransferase [Pseudomonas sp. CM25]|uniref:GNAT family N-acetyltransferase n=1 Tax=unclassified Pseudomonas TaxID=196821 RepID=UPI001556EDA0|nr:MULTISPECIES: GNAT family N-acetyltransferase [unclassified Pseudomonas]NQD55717.1 GNAT family N-acetyltransferase [Pseudomonas sp. CM25]NQD75671.1 GNAT family N-acetyltransferase [Pseudomonas sp. CM27]
MQLVDYEQLSERQRDCLDTLQLPLDQQYYAGDIATALYSLLNARSDDTRGLVLLLDEMPRVFLLLQRGAFLPAWAQPGAAIVNALQVDQRFQGLGLGSACMRALPGHVRALWPDVDRLQLSVHPDNLAALALYRATGWLDSGNGYRARTGYERQLTLML